MRREGGRLLPTTLADAVAEVAGFEPARGL